MKIAALLLCALPLSLLAEGGLPNQPYIYVEGKAEVERPADLVTLKFNLVGRNPDQVKANADVQGKANRVFALLTSYKIADNDVIATNLKSEPGFERMEESPQGRGKIINYRVTRSFALRVHDLPSFPKLANDIIAIGGTEFSGIESGLSNERELDREVWETAISNARESAEKTLQLMRMKIDSVFTVSPVSVLRIQEEIFGFESLPAATGGSVSPQIATLPQYRLAPITLRQNVHVIYLISPLK